MHLRFDLQTAYIKYNNNKHAQQVMKDLNITYQHSTPQSIADQWWFWNCQNVPDILPEYLTILEVDPINCIGYGLSKEKAEEIKRNETK